jgi:hypothetical protein
MHPYSSSVFFFFTVLWWRQTAIWTQCLVLAKQQVVYPLSHISSLFAFTNLGMGSWIYAWANLDHEYLFILSTVAGMTSMHHHIHPLVEVRNLINFLASWSQTVIFPISTSWVRRVKAWAIVPGWKFSFYIYLSLLLCALCLVYLFQHFTLNLFFTLNQKCHFPHSVSLSFVDLFSVFILLHLLCRIYACHFFIFYILLLLTFH